MKVGFARRPFAVALAIAALSALPSVEAGFGVVRVPDTPGKSTYVGIDQQANVCNDDLGCYSAGIALEFVYTPLGWMAFSQELTSLYAYVARFGPLQGSPSEGFHYQFDSVGSNPERYCDGVIHLTFDTSPLGEGTTFELQVYADGTRPRTVPPDPSGNECSDHWMSGTADFV
jgi:hypothetical protein